MSEWQGRVSRVNGTLEHAHLGHVNARIIH